VPDRDCDYDRIPEQRNANDDKLFFKYFNLQLFADQPLLPVQLSTACRINNGTFNSIILVLVAGCRFQFVFLNCSWIKALEQMLKSWTMDERKVTGRNN
jgi:hypothetical protein